MSPVEPVFDGHNDALTADDHAGLATGRVGGHLDLPRMQAGGVRGAIFAVFTPSEHEREQPLPREDGVIEFELAAPVSHARAAAHASAAAGRLAELERGGHAAHRPDDPGCRRGARWLRAAGGRSASGGRRGDRSGAGGAGVLARGRTEIARTGLEPLQRVRPRRSVRLPLLAGHRTGFDRRGRRAGPPLRRAGDPGRPQSSQRGRLLGRRGAGGRVRWWPATRPRTPSARRHATSPTPSSTRSGPAAGWWGSSSPVRSSGRTSPRTRTRRSS